MHYEDPYHNLLEEILNKDNAKTDRTGTGTTSIFGAQMRFDLSTHFPLLTTKSVWFKGVAIELLWLLRGETNIGYMLDHGVHIWDEWTPAYKRGGACLLYTSPSPRDQRGSRMPSSA